MKLGHRFINLTLLLIGVIFLYYFFFHHYGQPNAGLPFSSFLSSTQQNLISSQKCYPDDSSPQAKPDNKPEVMLPIRPGEKLRYGIYSSGIKVGNANITYLGKRLLNNLLLDCITLEAWAPGFYDREVIYGDLTIYSPVRVERTVKLFGKNMSITEEYKEREVTITHKNGDVTVSKIKANDRISHVILLLYYLRFLHKPELKEVLHFTLPTKSLQMSVDKTVRIDVPKGRFNTIFIKSVPPQFRLWLNNEGDRYPVRIDGAIGFGTTYLALTAIETP